jgi:hypothetical protein
LRMTMAELMAALRWALADGVYLSFNQKYL